MMVHLVDIFIQMENELSLYDKQIKDFYYWDYIREEIYSNFDSYVNSTPCGFSKTHISIKQMPKLLWDCMFKKEYHYSHFKRPIDVMFVCHPRRILSDNSYVSIYTDLVANAFDNSVTIEYPHEGFHYKPCFSRNVCYLDFMYYVRALIQKLPTCSLSPGELNTIRSTIVLVKNYLLTYTGYDLDVDGVVKRIVFFYKRYRYTFSYFDRMLNRLQPRIIVEVVHYRFENMVLNQVAKQYKIPTVELQHGLTGKYHIAYNYGDIKKNECLPDFFLSFSDYWSSAMRLPDSIVKKEAVGFPYYERRIHEYKMDCNPTIILFLSSGTIGASLSKVAIELNTLLIGTKYRIVYKLHPGEFADWRERYQELAKSSISVIDNADIDLYSLFSKSVAQVGVYSTALFEGLGYKLKTYILDVGHTEHIECLLEKKYAILINNAQEIKKDLVSTGTSDIDSSFFWKENAYENMVRAILCISNS